MPDPFEVIGKIPFHFNGNPLNEQFFLLGKQFRRHGPQALFSIRTIGSAAEIHPWVNHLMPAVAAFAG
jgi:hypothetical protein